MNYNDIINEAKSHSDEIVRMRRYLHTNPETGFDLPVTKDFVISELKKIGYIPKECGKCGVTADLKQPGKHRTVLLCADMDALPIEEKTDIEFKSKNNNMHGCGHDMHTAMLLGCAKILKQHEDEINARELSLNEKALITIGTINGGTSVNSISDNTVLDGIMRCFSSECREKIRKRTDEISKSVSNAFRTESTVTFGSGCPELINNKELSEKMSGYITEFLGKEYTVTSNELDSHSSKASGSENFAYVSQKVPSLMLALGAGDKREGYSFSQHHPEVIFDEDAMPVGSAVYAYAAIRLLEDK